MTEMPSGTLWKNPSAWIPLVLSLAALLLILGTLATSGVPHQPPHDEGTLAHLWQLLIGTQALFVLYFAIRYVPTKPKEAFPIFLAQIIMALAACAPVFLLRL